MRAGGYAFCDECKRTFVSNQRDPPGVIRHPAATDYPELNAGSAWLYEKCSSAGKYFRNPVMEEVDAPKEEKS